MTKNKNEVLEKVLAIIRGKLHINPGELCEKTLLQEIGVDSITLMTMIIYIEQEFQIKINFDENITGENASPTIKNIVDLVIKYQNV